MRKYGEVYHYKAPADMALSGDLWVMAVTEDAGVLVGALTTSGQLHDYVADIGSVDTPWAWDNFHSLDTCYFTCP